MTDSLIIRPITKSEISILDKMLYDPIFVAPGNERLPDNNIVWKEIDNIKVDAKYTNGNITITATLFFNEEGELVNFFSNDRFETTDGKTYKNYPWITPVTGYNRKWTPPSFRCKTNI